MKSLSLPTTSPHPLGAARLRAAIANRLEAGFVARHTAFGLRRDLQIPMKAPAARIPIHVRKLADADIPILFPADQSALDAKEKLELGWRRAFLETGIPQCYVAVDERNGEPCYFQWLIGAKDNARLAPLKQFHRLADDEALLENAYTPVHYRAKGIMPAAMALIAERATEIGARYVTTFVGLENTPSLKGCRKAGFAPEFLRHQTNLGFNTIKLLRFTDLAADDPRRQ